MWTRHAVVRPRWLGKNKMNLPWEYYPRLLSHVYFVTGPCFPMSSRNGCLQNGSGDPGGMVVGTVVGQTPPVPMDTRAPFDHY